MKVLRLGEAHRERAWLGSWVFLLSRKSRGRPLNLEQREGGRGADNRRLAVHMRTSLPIF